jgi:hypothetical protein
MLNHKAIFETLRDSERVSIGFKNESRMMRTIGRLMFFNPTFMTTFTTTIGETVYYPSREYVERNYFNAWNILAHEVVHISDYRESKPKWLWMLKYGFPQILAVFALLAPILWSWWPLLALLFLAPLPAPWRTSAEMRGYAMSMAVWYWYFHSGIPLGMKIDITGNFTGPQYYYTYPFHGKATAEVGRWSKRVLCNEMNQYGDVFKRVRKLIESSRPPM